MKKISKKSVVSFVFISIVTTFVLSSNNVFANEFEGREDEWTALCSTYLQDQETINKCTEYRNYLMDVKTEKQNEAALAQSKIDGMQGDIDELAKLSYQYSQDVAAANAEVDAINNAIAESDAALEKLDVQILEKTEVVNMRMEVVLERMIDIQVSINTNEYINMIMGSEDLISFIKRTQDIAVFTDLDKEAIDELQEAVTALENDKSEQVRIKDMQEVQKVSLVEKKAKAEEIAAANEQVYTALVNESANLAAARDSSNAAANELSKDISVLIPTVTGPPGGGNAANAGFYGGWYEPGLNIFSPAYTGQCTWYVYGRVNELTGGANTNLPTGDASQWIYQAQARGYQTGNTPRTHSIMVWASGFYGHVAYIESYDGVNIRASEANVNAPGGGLPMYTDLETAIRYTVDATWTYSQYVAVRGYPIGFIYL